MSSHAKAPGRKAEKFNYEAMKPGKIFPRMTLMGTDKINPSLKADLCWWSVASRRAQLQVGLLSRRSFSEGGLRPTRRG
jgi:hypothetical protein